MLNLAATDKKNCGGGGEPPPQEKIQILKLLTKSEIILPIITHPLYDIGPIIYFTYTYNILYGVGGLKFCINFNVN
jgi:formate hydrogenlyase subunit 4